MTTTRSLLRDLSTAFWISRNLQRLASLRLNEARRLACLGLNPRTSVGRSWIPWRRLARRIERSARLSDPRWQTTRVRPTGLVFRAEYSDRTLGTAPPAAGLTLVSGAGLGKY